MQFCSVSVISCLACFPSVAFMPAEGPMDSFFLLSGTCVMMKHSQGCSTGAVGI